MRAACQQAARWNRKGFSISIAVNVAARQFGLDDFLQTVKRILAENGIPNHALELEVTETALMQDMEKTQTLISELKALGISIAIDDFGTGYSSLSYLKKFKADTLKIDMSFIRDMLEDQSDLDIVSTIIALGKNMKLTIVAEGVELEAQREKLSELGCDIGQGYLYSPAVPADQFMELLLKSNQ